MPRTSLPPSAVLTSIFSLRPGCQLDPEELSLRIMRLHTSRPRMCAALRCDKLKSFARSSALSSSLI